MNDAAALVKQFQTLVSAAGQTALDTLSVFRTVAMATVADNAFITRRNVLFASPNQCHLDRALDVSGFATTGDDGKLIFKLSDLLCRTGDTFLPPVNVVATPISTTPCFIAVNSRLLINGSDVEIQVSIWNFDGSAAAGVAFNWRCRAELPLQF